MNMLHITLTDCRHESRLLKHCASVSQLASIDEIFTAALSSEKAPLEEQQGVVQLKRFTLRTRTLGKGLITQLFKYFEFCFRVVVNYRKDNVGVVVVHSLGLLPLGFVCKKIYDAKLVYDAHELETEANGLSGLRKRLSKVVERVFIGRCDLTLVVSQSIMNWYEREYHNINIELVMNTPVLPDREEEKQSISLRSRLGIAESDLLAIYVGAYSPGRAIEQLLNAFSNMKDGNVHVCFVGYGVLDEVIQQSANQHRNIHTLPAVAPNEVVSLIKSADAGVCGGENACISYDFSMPNKLFEYLHAGVPIIAPELTEMKRFVGQYKVGVVVRDLSDSALMINALTYCHQQRPNIEKNALELSRVYSWQEQEVRLLAAYNKLGVD